MKTSNKLLLVAFIVIVIAMIFSNLLNRNQVKVYNKQTIEINNIDNTVTIDSTANNQ